MYRIVTYLGLITRWMAEIGRGFGTNAIDRARCRPDSWLSMSDCPELFSFTYFTMSSNPPIHLPLSLSDGSVSAWTNVSIKMPIVEIKHPSRLREWFQWECLFLRFGASPVLLLSTRTHQLRGMAALKNAIAARHSGSIDGRPKARDQMWSSIGAIWIKAICTIMFPVRTKRSLRLCNVGFWYACDYSIIVRMCGNIPAEMGLFLQNSYSSCYRGRREAFLIILLNRWMRRRAWAILILRWRWI